MKRLAPLGFILCCLASPLILADQVVRQIPDTTAGKGFGAGTGMMVGAIGGPIGALVGAGIGFFAGGSAQEATGKTDTAYEVRSPDGELHIVRSPNTNFVVGQEVTRKGGRLIPTS